MSGVPLPQTANFPQGHVEPHDSEIEWLRPTVGGTLLVGSLLILSGKRKAGLVVAAAGAALALLEEQDAVAEWWRGLPRYLDEAQRFLNQAQRTIDDLSSKRDKLRSMFHS